LQSPEAVVQAHAAEHQPGPTAQLELIAGSAARIVRLKDGRRVALRVTRSADVSAVQQFVRGLSDRSRRNRFFAPVRELSPDQLHRVTRSRPPSEVALVGETAEGAGSRIVAMAQYAVCETREAEFAVVVDDAWQRQGLGSELLGLLAEHAVRAGLGAFAGFVLRDNWPMLAFLTRLGCELVTDTDPYMLRALKRLDARGLAV
jgi:acetyltransferase